MKKGHIFVQIASYRDPELKNTIRSALHQAANPETISFGICWQGRSNEINQLYMQALPACRTVLIEADATKGIGYARHKAQLMHEDEEYVLQIDSHMRFEPNWDRMSIRMLDQCDSPKPLLTAYLSDWGKSEPAVAYRLGTDRFNEKGKLFLFGTEEVKDVQAPVPGILCSGHYLFARAELFQEVPPDPELQFLHEEIVLAPRAYTAGWDIYHPNRAPLRHKWDRDYRVCNWDDRDMSPLEQKSHRRYLQLLGIKPGFGNLGAYGLGQKRSLQDYELYSGINFSAQTFTKRAVRGLPAR